MKEEAEREAAHGGPVRVPQELGGSALDGLDARQRATTRAAPRRPGRRDVAVRVADEGHAQVVKIGEDYLAGLALARGPRGSVLVDEDFDDEVLHRYMEPVVR